MIQQTLKLTATGSFFNYLMGNNQSVPEVGKSATILHWTDRSAFEVVEVQEGGKRVQLEGLTAIRTDTNGMSDDQSYRYEADGRKFFLVWRNGAWRRECEVVHFTDEALNLSHQERVALCYDAENAHPKLVPWLTFIKKSYPKVNIIFGVKRAYHDYSF